MTTIVAVCTVFAIFSLAVAHNPPSYGFSYVDPGGHFIDVKFGRSSPSSPPFSGNLFNLPEVKRHLFRPAYDEYEVVSRGQIEEYVKFLKEAAEEDAKEAEAMMRNATATTSRAYVSVKVGANGYNYRY